MPLLKKLLIAIPIALVSLLVVAVIAFFLIDDKTIEDNALEALQNTLNREVRVDGTFTLSRSLHPTLQTTGVHIASADWDNNNYLLDAEKLELGISLLDLLIGVISIENVVFDNTTINMKRNADGISNFQFSTNEQKSKSESTTTARLDIIDIDINNLKVNYSDEQNGKSFVYHLETFTLDPINKETIQFSANSHFDEQPISVSGKSCRIRHLLAGKDCNLTAEIEAAPLSTSIKGAANIAKRGNLDISIESTAKDISQLKLLAQTNLPSTQSIEASLNINGPFDQLQLSQLNIGTEIENSKISASGGVENINLLSGINVSAQAEGKQPEWLNQFQDIFPAENIDEFSVDVTINDMDDGWRIHNIDSSIDIDNTNITTTGEVSIAQASAIYDLDIDAKGKSPEWLNHFQQAIATENIDEFSIQAKVHNPDNIISIDNLVSIIKVDDTNTTTKGSIKLNDNNEATIIVNINSTGKNLKSFEKILQQPMPESKNFTLDTNIEYSQPKLVLDKIALNIDNTNLSGTSTIQLTSPPNITAKLNADSLNIEHLLALIETDNPKKEKEESNKDEPLFSDKPIDLQWMQSANTDILLEIDQLIYKDATVKNVVASALAKDNLAKVTISSLKYLDANLKASAEINANDNTYKHNLYTESFDLGQLLQQIDVSDTLQGKIDASIDLSSSGTSSKQIASNSTGKITAIMTEGALEDAPIDLLASNLLVELMPGKSKKDTTKIECLLVQFSGEKGLFESEATLLNTENIVMTTTGSVNLSEEKLNLLLVPKPKDIELFTLDANIRVAGNITDPGFSLDKGSLLKKVLKSAASVALGPAALAIPFASMGNNKNEKCFSEVASTTTKAVEAQIEAERIAREEAEKKAQEEALKEAEVEPLDL